MTTERPLKNRTIVVTRASDQAKEFRLLLEKAGADVIEVPTIEIVPRDEPGLDRAIERAERYDWLLFTSANAVQIFFRRLRRFKDPPTLPPICAIGPGTASAVKEAGARVALLPKYYQAEGILEALGRRHECFQGVRILLPRASKARDILPNTLRKQGAQVDLIPVYDTVPPEGSSERVKELLREFEIDLVTFASSSTVSNFVTLAANSSRLSNLKCGVIGPITARTAEHYGLQVVVQPKKSTIPAFAEAICCHFRPDGP